MALTIRRTASRLLAIALALAGAACTTVTITPQSMTAPTQTYRTVVLTGAETQNPDFVYLVKPFREGFLRRSTELKGFDTVVDLAPNPLPPDAILVSVVITDADKGNEALRLFVGMGAGREHVTAQLKIADAVGKPVGQFEARKAYSGGLGIGGAGFIDLESLTTQVGEQAAQSLLDWSKGKVVAGVGGQ